MTVKESLKEASSNSCKKAAVRRMRTHRELTSKSTSTKKLIFPTVTDYKKPVISAVCKYFVKIAVKWRKEKRKKKTGQMGVGTKAC